MKTLLFISVSVLLLTSCATSKYMTSSTPANEITKLSYFEPLSIILYIEKGNKAFVSDSLSGITKSKLDSVLSDHRSTFVPTEKIAFGNDVVREKYRNELVDLSALIAEKKTLKMIPVPFTIDSIIKNSHDRFALATVATGFGRRKGNYAGQVAKSAAVGLLTLGMYIPVSVKSSLVMHAFIFDSEKNEIAFYKKSFPVEKEPTDPEVLNRELNKLFNGYFYQKK